MREINSLRQTTNSYGNTVWLGLMELFNGLNTEQTNFTHPGYLYSASSSPLLLRGAPDTARILCRSFTPKRHRQLRVKGLPKVSTWRIERDSNPRPFEVRTKVAESTKGHP